MFQVGRVPTSVNQDNGTCRVRENVTLSKIGGGKQNNSLYKEISKTRNLLKREHSHVQT